MAEISAFTPSPPGLGEPHPSPSLPHSPPPTDTSQLPPIPKSALYGDTSVTAPWRGGKETPSASLRGQGPPPTPPKPVLSAPPLGRGSGIVKEDCIGAEMVPSTPPPPVNEEGVLNASKQAETCPSLPPESLSNPHMGANVNQTPNPIANPYQITLPAASVITLVPSGTQDPPPSSTIISNPLSSPQKTNPNFSRPEPSPPIPVVQEPAPTFSLPNPRARPAPDTLSYLESASLMSGTMESLSGLGDDGSSVGSDSEVNGMMPRRTDKYGFLGGTQYTEGSGADVRVDVARQREMKWLDMFKNWDKWVMRRFQKVKLRCRKGIPSSLRAKAWQLLSNSQELVDSNQGKFEELEREPGDPKWLDIIEKDLHRQFPFHEMFAARGGHGQQDLYRILKAYTIYRPDEGYCQAQAPVAAVLLMHMPAEQAFWCLVQICEKYLPGYYSAGLEAIQLDGEIFFSLLRRVCPMAYRHLKKFKIDPILYMTEWFMCIFSRTLPWACVLRVWDMFFCEGVKIVFRVGLVLLKQTLGSVDKLRELQGMYETMERLRNIPTDSIREDILVQEVVTLPVTEALIERESSVQVRKWKESRGDLTHQPSRRLHGTRVIYEIKHRSAAISSGGSFSFLSGPAPPPGPLRVSSSLLSLPGLRKSKTPLRTVGRKDSLPGGSGIDFTQAPSWKPPPCPRPLLAASPLVTSAQSANPKPAPPVAQAEPEALPRKNLTPPQTLVPSPRIVSEQITPSLPSPAANNAPLPPAVGSEDESKKKKRSKEVKKKEKEEVKKEKEEEKKKEKERKEREKLEKEREKLDKERQKKDKERVEKERKKGSKKKEKVVSEVEEKNGAAAPRDSA